MTAALPHLSTTSWVLVVVGALLVLAVLAAITGRLLVRRGLRTPWVIRAINRGSERVITIVKRPITVAVLDEVADVLRTGHYTRNVAAALDENRAEIRDMIAEKIRNDPAGRPLGLVPFHDRIVNEITETALRVLLEVLADARMEELVSDIVRDNVDQIRRAIRDADALR